MCENDNCNQGRNCTCRGSAMHPSDKIVLVACTLTALALFVMASMGWLA